MPYGGMSTDLSTTPTVVWVQTAMSMLIAVPLLTNLILQTSNRQGKGIAL